MAKINANTDEKVISLKKWLGLNQSADGDTMLKVGEASVMKNFKVTRDGTLKRRPGRTKLAGLGAIYIAQPETTARTVCSTKADATLEVYGGVSASSHKGFLTLQSSQGECTPAEAAALLEEAAQQIAQYYYIKYDGHVWRLTSVEESGPKWKWNGKKIYALAGSTYSRLPAWIWSGYVGGHEQFVAACQGYLYALWDYENEEFYTTPVTIGPLASPFDPDDYAEQVCFFPFGNKLYILTDKEYYEWDGDHSVPLLSPVSGYAPLIATSLEPTTTVDNTSVPGSYELTGEAINRLCGQRRVWLSGDGENATFQLPEKNLASIDAVISLSTGTAYTKNTHYETDATNGTVTFKPGFIPTESPNSVEVNYTVYARNTSDETATYWKYRNQIIHNTAFELYSGKTDTVVFLYGDGTNKCVYSGMDYNGQPMADYFPDLNDIAIGDENTPITQLIRHSSALLAFKKDSAWAIQQDIITLADGSQTFGYYVSPVNKAVGNEALGQVQLVNNNPITLYNKNIYQWVNRSYYSSNLTRDERQAKVISDRVHTICDELDFENVMMWDDNDHQELYISNQNDKTLVWNYAADAWYEYDIGPYSFTNFHGTLYMVDWAAHLCSFDEDADTEGEENDEYAINSEWVSGAMDFGVDYSRKYSSMLWVGLKAEEGTSVDVTVRTDRKDTFKDKVVSSDKAKVPGEPFMVKTKIKAKKFVYYRLILESEEKAPPVTVTAADIRVRMTGYAK